MQELKQLEEKLGEPCSLIAPLGGEGIYLISAGGRKLVAKFHPQAEIEARMLRLLAPHMNVPQVVEPLVWAISSPSW